MLAFIRTWWLLNRLAKESLEAEVAFGHSRMSDSSVQDFMSARNFTFSDHPELGTYPLEKFLTHQANKYLFGWGCRTERARHYRIERDRKHLDRVKNVVPSLVDIFYLPEPGSEDGKYIPTTSYVVITPEGDFFAKPANGLVEFATRYKIIWVIVPGLYLVSATIRGWLAMATAPISPWW